MPTPNKCLVCRGTGLKRGSLCSKCGGYGRIRWARRHAAKAVGLVRCSACRGSGLCGGELCKTCKGYGAKGGTFRRHISGPRNKRITRRAPRRQHTKPWSLPERHWPKLVAKFVEPYESPEHQQARKLSQKLARQFVPHGVGLFRKDRLPHNIAVCRPCQGVGQLRGMKCERCDGHGQHELTEPPDVYADRLFRAATARQLPLAPIQALIVHKDEFGWTPAELDALRTAVRTYNVQYS